MSGEDALLALIADGRRMLAEERALCLGGGFARMAGLADEKRALLEHLERAIPAARGTLAVRRALAGLIEASRANERLLSAALAGIASARRRIAAIEAERRGDVAYAEDGSRIVSRDDAAGRTSRA